MRAIFGLWCALVVMLLLETVSPEFAQVSISSEPAVKFSDY